MGVWLLTVALARAACDDPVPLLLELERAAIEGRLAEGEAQRSQLMAAFACGSLGGPEPFARMWLADAVLFSLRGEDDAATDALAAAARSAPEVWSDVYGPEFHRRHRAAADVDPGVGRIVFEVRVSGELPADRPVLTALDGRPVVSPVSVAAGLHVAQLGFGPDDLRFAQEVYLVPGQDLIVRATLQGTTAPPASAVPPVERPGPRRVPGWLVAAGLTGLGAGITAGAALGQNDAMRDATTRDALDDAFRTQRALGVTSYALMGAAAACLSLEVVL